ncbi:nuclear transport factor 2 family protein [Streptomyces xiamenensis]
MPPLDELSHRRDDVAAGDRARATANQLTYFYRDGEAPHRTSGLRTACTAVRTPAGRRFDGMVIALAWLNEN